MALVADVLCGNGFEALGTVVVTGVASVVACAAPGGVFAEVPGCSDGGGVTAGVWMGTGGGGCDVTTDGFVAGTSIADGNDGAAGSEGGCWRGVDAFSGIRICGGTSLSGPRGLTGVVDGPVAGSAKAGEIPPVIAVNEMAVPAASPTINPRPRQVPLIGV